MSRLSSLENELRFLMRQHIGCRESQKLAPNESDAWDYCNNNFNAQSYIKRWHDFQAQKEDRALRAQELRDIIGVERANQIGTEVAREYLRDNPRTLLKDLL